MDTKEETSGFVPEIHVRPTREIEGFSLEDLSEATPDQVPEGIPYSYNGAVPSFLEAEGEGGCGWSSFIKHDSDALERPLPEGIEFGSTYVNWQGKRYMQTGGGRGEERKWEEVKVPAEVPTVTE